MPDKTTLILEANWLIGRFGLSYGQIAKYFEKRYGGVFHRQTIYRWLN